MERTEEAMRPRIGITVAEWDPAADPEEWEGHARYYIERILEAGGKPVMLAPSNTPADPQVLDNLDALLLSGGGDIDPARYGESMDGSETERMNAARDELELSLTRWAVERNLPVLGICRGIQVLNVALGGRLVQHIEGHRVSGEGWVQHWIHLEPDSRLARVLGVDGRIVVNSHHHQAVTKDRIAPGLVPVAHDEETDGLLEAIESPQHDWVIGVQWHPERAWELPEFHQRLFQAFVRAAQKKG